MVGGTAEGMDVQHRNLAAPSTEENSTGHPSRR